MTAPPCPHPTLFMFDADQARAGLAAVVGLLWRLANEPLEAP